MTGQINYGGRVTDDWDRRCLLNILRVFYNEKILGEGYKFSPSGLYYAPAEAPFSEYVAYIAQLPAFEDPEVFGPSQRFAEHFHTFRVGAQALTDPQIRRSDLSAFCIRE